MPAADEPEQFSLAGFAPRLLMRFGLVGMISTGIYAVLAGLLVSQSWFALGAVEASLTAYGAAALFSYFAHKIVTFVSRGRHRREAPRFILLSATGFAVAYSAPAVLTGWFGLPPMVPIMVTCIAIPVLNLFVLSRWVFPAQASDG